MTIEAEERAKRAVEALRKPDASLARVPNTVRQSIAEVIEDRAALWQPIKTAPKETRVLVYRPAAGPDHQIDVDCWRARYNAWAHSRPAEQPTHWRRLPDPPETLVG